MYTIILLYTKRVTGVKHVILFKIEYALCSNPFAQINPQIWDFGWRNTPNTKAIIITYFFLGRSTGTSLRRLQALLPFKVRSLVYPPAVVATNGSPAWCRTGEPTSVCVSEVRLSAIALDRHTNKKTEKTINSAYLTRLGVPFATRPSLPSLLLHGS